jgi:hypothetical protein
MPVLMASIGVYCFTAGGFFSSARRIRGSSLATSGSTCAGHQFFGGSLKKNPLTATNAARKTPTANRIPS